MEALLRVVLLILMIQSNVESGLKIIQFRIPFKSKELLVIHSNKNSYFEKSVVKSVINHKPLAKVQ